MSKSRVYDQWALAELFGGNIPYSSMGVSVLRVLLNSGTTGEGTLAAKVGSRTFRPDWRPVIEKLHEEGYVLLQSSGVGVARKASLTPKGLEFLEEYGVQKETAAPAYEVTGADNVLRTTATE